LVDLVLPLFKKKNILVVVPGAKCSQKNFENFFRSKNKLLGPVQMPQKTGDLVPVLKVKN
jgi:hypothetical protein